MTPRLKRNGLVASGIVFFIIFSLLFSGDYELLGLPVLYYIVLPVALVARLLFYPLQQTDLIAVLVAGIAVLPPMILHAENSSQNYYLLGLCVMVTCVVFPIFKSFFRLERVSLFILLSLAVLFAQAFSGFLSGHVRVAAVFGPNIMYRIILFLCFGYFLLQLRKNTKQVRGLIIFFPGLFAVLATGSRGGLVSWFVLFLLALFISLGRTYKFGRNFWYYFPGIAFFMVGVVALLQQAQDYFTRPFYFDFEGSVRFGFFERYVSFYQEANILDLLFGAGRDSHWFFFYPHNLFLEVSVWWGVGPLILIVGYMISIGFAIRESVVSKMPSNALLASLLVLPVFLGAQFSGSLFESSIVVALGAVFISSTFASKRRAKFRITTCYSAR